MILAAAAPAATQPGAPVWFIVFAGLVTAIGGGSGIAALLLVSSQRRKARSEGNKNEADGAQAISNAAVGLLKPLEERIDRAETENRTLTTRLTRADARIESQQQTLTGLRVDVRELRSLLRRVVAIIATGRANDPGRDPAAVLTEVRDLLDDHAHQLVD